MGERLEYVKVYEVYESNVSTLNYVTSFIRKEIGELYAKVLIMIVLRVGITVNSYSFFLLFAIIPEFTMRKLLTL